MSTGSRFFRTDSSADYVALDWESTGVRLVAARVGGGRITPLGAASADWSTEADGTRNTAATANALRRALQDLAVKSPRALLVLPRDLVVVRKLDLPAVPDQELPDLVRLQAATKLATPVDQLALDFLPLATNSDDLGRAVLLVSADQDRLQGMVEAARLAGLEPVGAVTSTISVAELALRSIDRSSGLILVAYQHRRRLELSALYERVPIFSYSLTLPDGDAVGQSQLLRAELSRVQVAVRQAQHDVNIGRVLVIQDGDRDESVLSVLRERFSDLVHVLDAAELHRGAGAGTAMPADVSAVALGALLAESAPLMPTLDFLRPRRAPRQANPRRQRMQIAGAAAGVILLLAGFTYYRMLSNRDAQIAQTQDRQSKLEQLVNRPASKATLAAAAGLDAWSNEAASPLSVIAQLQSFLPGTDRLYFTQLRFTPEAGTAIARLTGSGFARTRSDIDDLNQRLADAGHIVTAKPHSTATKNPDYPVAFDLNVSISSPPTSKPPQLAGNR